MAISTCTRRTVFIGPVQSGGGNLNYTKFSYFTLWEVEEFRLEKSLKTSPRMVLHIFGEPCSGALVDKISKFIVMNPLDCG
jgi:hypothetical protein